MKSLAGLLHPIVERRRFGILGASLQFRFPVYKIYKQELGTDTYYPETSMTPYYQLFQKERHLPTPVFSGKYACFRDDTSQRCPSSTGPWGWRGCWKCQGLCAQSGGGLLRQRRHNRAGDHFLRVFGKLKTPEIERGINSEFSDSIFQYFKQVGAPESVRKLQGSMHFFVERP